MSETKISFLNTLGKRKFIAYLTLLVSSQLINTLALIFSKCAVVIFSPTFFITTFSIYMGVKEIAEMYKKKIESQGEK